MRYHNTTTRGWRVPTFHAGTSISVVPECRRLFVQCRNVGSIGADPEAQPGFWATRIVNRLNVVSSTT